MWLESPLHLLLEAFPPTILFLPSFLNVNNSKDWPFTVGPLPDHQGLAFLPHPSNDVDMVVRTTKFRYLLQ